MLESGIIVFLGLLFIAAKLPTRVLLRMLNYPITIDIVVTIGVFILHGGTYSGGIAAAFAGMMCSLATTIGRKVFGYIDGNRYYQGLIEYRPEDLK